MFTVLPGHALSTVAGIERSRQHGLLWVVISRVLVMMVVVRMVRRRVATASGAAVIASRGITKASAQYV